MKKLLIIALVLAMVFALSTSVLAVDSPTQGETGEGDGQDPNSPPTGEALPIGFIASAVLFGAAGVCFLAKSKENA